MTGPSGGTPRRLVFHIGLEKTGTTSLQHFCADHAALLRRHGLLYPRRNAGYGLYNHAGLAAAYLEGPERDFTVVRIHRERGRVVASLRAEIDRSAAPTVLLSAEHFSSRFGAPQVARLWADFEGFDRRVLVVVRDHLARLTSSYATYVWSGGTDGLNDYARRTLHPDSAYLRVRDTVERWAAVAGPDALTIIDYDQHRDIVPAILEPLAPGIAVGPRRRYRDKAALTPGAVEAVRLANLAVVRRQGRAASGLAPWLQRRLFQRLAARAVAALDASDHAGRWPIDRDVRDTLAAVAAADRDWLQVRFGLAATPGGTARPGEEADPAQVTERAAALLADALTRAGTGPLWPIVDALVAARGWLSPRR